MPGSSVKTMAETQLRDRMGLVKTFSNFISKDIMNIPFTIYFKCSPRVPGLLTRRYMHVLYFFCFFFGWGGDETWITWRVSRNLNIDCLPLEWTAHDEVLSAGDFPNLQRRQDTGATCQKRGNAASQSCRDSQPATYGSAPVRPTWTCAKQIYNWRSSMSLTVITNLVGLVLGAQR